MITLVKIFHLKFFKPVTSNSRNRIVGLDSLRFIAFFLVFLFHVSRTFYFGFLGVDFFFVLSSFLLTYLALQEIDQTGTFSKSNFFIRRVLRIFPLYYLILIICLILLPFLSNKVDQSITLPEKPWFFWVFLANYENSDYILPLKFLWSVAVEEQFYLLFLVLSLAFRKYFVWIVLGLIVLYLIFFQINEYYDWESYKNVAFHFANFGFGMLGGWIFYKHTISKILRIVLIGLSSLLLFLTPYDHWFFNIILSIWFLSLIFGVEQIASHLSNNLIFRLTEYLGKYTYGLYMYSGLMIILINKTPLKEHIFAIPLKFILTVIAAFLSYHLFESQFLKLKSKFRRT